MGRTVPVQSMKAYRRRRGIAPTIFRHFTIAARMPLSFTTPVSATRNSVAPTGWIFVKFHITDFHKSPSKNSTFGLNCTIRSDTLYKNLSMFHTFGATIQRTHSCASMATLSTFITLFTATYYAKTERNTLWYFHGKKGYANAP